MTFVGNALADGEPPTSGGELTVTSCELPAVRYVGRNGSNIACDVPGSSAG